MQTRTLTDVAYHVCLLWFPPQDVEARASLGRRALARGRSLHALGGYHCLPVAVDVLRFPNPSPGARTSGASEHGYISSSPFDARIET